MIKNKFSFLWIIGFVLVLGALLAPQAHGEVAATGGDTVTTYVSGGIDLLGLDGQQCRLAAGRPF